MASENDLTAVESVSMLRNGAQPIRVEPLGRRDRTWKMTILIATAVVALISMSAIMEAGAWGAGGGTSTAVITFDDAAQQVTLTIPTPACPGTQPTCQWKFFLNEPKLSVDVSTIYGTSGVLTLAYPKDFCGVIQADAYVGPPWVAKRGFQHTIEDCNPVTTPTSAPPPTSTTTTTDDEPSTTTTSTTSTTPPPGDAPTSVPPTPPSAGAAATSPPVVAAAAVTPAALPASSAVPATVAASSAPSQLPFTGVDFESLLVMGLASVALGLCLLVRLRPGVHSRGRVSARRH